MLATATILLLIGSSWNSPIVPSDEKMLNRCITGERFFWEVCLIHFREAKSLTLNILVAREYHSIIGKFTDRILVYLYLNVGLNKTITIRKTCYGRKSRRPRRKTRSQRVRHYSGEPEDAYMVLIWDKFTLDLFLARDPQLVFPNPRATYFVLFLAMHAEGCDRTDVDIVETLPRLWGEFGVLNVMANAPCSCVPKLAFVYDPFHRAGQTWGRIYRYDIGEILEDRKKILFSLGNLKGYPLRVAMFERIPTSVRWRNSEGYAGMDGMVLRNMARYLNFTDEVYGMDYDYGSMLENGTVTGSLGDVIDKRADLAANSRFLIDYGTDEIEFTSPVMNDLLCVIVPKSRRIPQWIMLFHCFALETWLFIAVTFAVIMIAWYLIRFSADIINRDVTSRSPALEICSVLFSVPVKLHRSFTQRIFLASCMALNVIVMGIFQGTLVTSFSVTSYYRDIDTLDEVADSSLRISTKLDLLDHDLTSGLMLRLARKRLTSGDKPSLSRAAFARDVAAIERKEDAKLLIETNYTDADGLPLLHVVNECPWSYFLSYIVPRGSAFLPRFNSVLIRFAEAGLIRKWYQDTVDSFIVSSRYQTNLTNGHLVDDPFTLADVQTAFYFLCVGTVASVVVFVCEVFLHTYWIRYKFTP